MLGNLQYGQRILIRDSNPKAFKLKAGDIISVKDIGDSDLLIEFNGRTSRIRKNTILDASAPLIEKDGKKYFELEDQGKHRCRLDCEICSAEVHYIYTNITGIPKLKGRMSAGDLEQFPRCYSHRIPCIKKEPTTYLIPNEEQMTKEPSLFESSSSVDDINVIVYKTAYALTFKNFNKLDVKKPTAIFVSDVLYATSFADKILYDCSYDTDFGPIAGPEKGKLLVPTNETPLNETILNFEGISELCDLGFNPLRYIHGSFYIWDQQILGAHTEYGELINNIPDYRAYRWAMAPEKIQDRSMRFHHLACAGKIEIRNDGFTFNYRPALYKVPKGMSMSSNDTFPIVI